MKAQTAPTTPTPSARTPVTHGQHADSCNTTASQNTQSSAKTNIECYLDALKRGVMLSG